MENRGKQIPLIDKVDYKLLQRLIDQLPTNQQEPIEILLATEGGDQELAFGIYDVLKRYTGVVTITIVGACQSAGILILQAAKKRLSLPNSTFLIHYGEETNTTKSTEKHNKYLDEVYKNIVIEKSKITKRRMNAWMDKEMYFYPKQALELNLIDEIIE